MVRTSGIVCLEFKDEAAALKASTTVAPTVWMKWLYCFYHTAWTATAAMTHSLNSSWSFLVVILSQGKESPLSVDALPPVSIILLYLSILRQHWAAYWTQMMNGCRLMGDSRPDANWHCCITSSPAFVFHLLLLFFSDQSDPLQLRLVTLKELCVPSWSIVMKYNPQEIA